MAKIIDLDLVTYALSTEPGASSAELVFDTTAKTIQLAKRGNLSDDGIQLQCLYSTIKNAWKNNDTLIKHDIPMLSIFDKKFEFINGWIPKDQTTINLLRDGGFAIKNTDNTSAQEFAGVITLGTLDVNDQVYYQQGSGEASANIVLTGAANQCIKIYGDGKTHGIDNTVAYDKRTYLKAFVRTQGKLYAQASMVDIGETSLTYQAYSLPLANSADLKIKLGDAAIATNTYQNIVIKYHATEFNADIGAAQYPFTVEIVGDKLSKEIIYEKVQYLLRQGVNIDTDGSGETIGKTADTLLKFVGDTLVTSPGVFISNINDIDANSIEFYDKNNVLRVNPYTASGTMSFSKTLQDDPQAKYVMFLKEGFGTDNAIIVNDDAGTPIKGAIDRGSISFSFDYDNNTQGTRAKGSDTAVVVVAIGESIAQHIKAESLLVRTKSNSVSLVSALERNFSNPA